MTTAWIYWLCSCWVLCRLLQWFGKWSLDAVFCGAQGMSVWLCCGPVLKVLGQGSFLHVGSKSAARGNLQTASSMIYHWDMMGCTAALPSVHCCLLMAIFLFLVLERNWQELCKVLAQLEAEDPFATALELLESWFHSLQLLTAPPPMVWIILEFCGMHQVSENEWVVIKKGFKSPASNFR